MRARRGLPSMVYARSASTVTPGGATADGPTISIARPPGFTSLRISPISSSGAATARAVNPS